jgi:hypothetical protein
VRHCRNWEDPTSKDWTDRPTSARDDAMAGADEQREITDKKNQGSPVDLPPSSDCYAEQPDDTFDSHARRAGNRFLRDDEGCKCIEPNSLSPIDQVSPCVFQPIKMRFHRDWSPHGYDRAVELFEKVSSRWRLRVRYIG